MVDNTILEDGHIKLNSQLYRLKSPLYAQYISPLTGKVNMGDSSLDNQVNLNTWSIKDQTEGALVSEMDESIHLQRYWWGNCYTDQRGHLLLSRLATALTALTTYPGEITDGGLEAWDDANTLTNWSFADTGTTTLERDGTNQRTGTYCAKISITTQGTGTLSQSLTWSNNYRSKSVTFRAWGYTSNAVGTVFSVSIYDGKTTTTSSTSSATSYAQVTHTKTIAADATELTIIMTATYSQGSGSTIVYFDDAECAAPYTGTVKKFINFNSELYLATGRNLWKLNAGGTAFDLLKSFFGRITDLIVSIGNNLYIFCGDDANYQYMSTAEAFTETNVKDANWGIQWNQKLFKFDTDGAGAYATAPNSATPDWVTGALTASLADVKDQIETFLIGKDASGSDVIYCATNGFLKVLDFTNDVWLDTALKLPDHPNGGKGAIYWNDGHYISYGLGIKKYVTGSTASISEVGLDRDDGIPVEFNGEITKLLGESSSGDMFALVDASQVTGTAKSSLWAFNGRAWRCWWYDSVSDDRAMYDAIVSSAYGYRLYWDCGGILYYITIPRGIQNIEQIIGTQTFTDAGIHITPWFDAGTAAFDKLLARVISYAKLVTTTETITIYYRVNKSSTILDLDHSGSKWTSLVALNTTGENGQVETALASGAGLSFETIQFRIDLARGSTTTLTPDLQGLVLAYEVSTGADGFWQYVFTILVEETEGGVDTRTKDTNIRTALATTALVPLIFDDAGTAHYCRLQLLNAVLQTGGNFNNEYTIQAVEK